MSITNEYRDKLYNIIKESNFNQDCLDYKNIIHLITQEVVDEAHKQSEEVIKLLNLTNIDSIRPMPKKITRIKSKNAKFQPDFKLNSDFIAMRINVKPSNIVEYCEILSNNVKNLNGYCNVRYVINDIVAVVYIYLPQIGYITELQIGSPFCFYVFRIDTKLRDIRNGITQMSDEYKVDLWDNNFYDDVKSKILEDNFYDWQTAVIEHYKKLNEVMPSF